MKALVMLLVFVAVLILMQLSIKSDCSVMPPKPVVPVGCRDLVAECVCDQNGDHCVIVWKCQPVEVTP